MIEQEREKEKEKEKPPNNIAGCFQVQMKNHFFFSSAILASAYKYMHRCLLLLFDFCRFLRNFISNIHKLYTHQCTQKTHMNTIYGFSKRQQQLK